MEDKKGEYLAGSFSYIHEEDSVKASKEQNKIMKLESQLDYSNPVIVYSLYCKIIEKNILETLEGVTYLIHLQNYLFDHESELPGPIPYIPASIVIKENTVISNPVSNTEVENTSENNKENEADDSAVSERLKRSEEILKRQKEQLVKKNKTDLFVYKIIIAFLVALILIMLFITIRSDSPNIINYRNVIQNEYADWEEKLNEKEKELNIREKELDNR